jgi:DNA-binding NarL/FixJ family response regulator
MISVVIVDDQDLVREGLRMLLQAESDMRVTGEAGDGSQALVEVRRVDPDVVLMDVRMPGLDGIQATAQLVRYGCRARILMLTTFDLDEYVYRAMKAGQAGSYSRTPAVANSPRPSGQRIRVTRCSHRRSPSD